MMDIMANQLDFLTNKLGYMGVEQSGPQIQEGVEDVNYVNQGGNNRNFNNYHPNRGGGNYNQLGNKMHPNLSYGNPNNALQQPPGFQVSNGMVEETKKPELEEVLMTFMKQTSECIADSNKRLGKVEAEVQSMNTHMKSIDNQISQIAQAVSSQHTPSQFPGQPKVNPKDCNAIHLRSGKSYEGPSMPETAVEQAKEAETELEKEEEPEMPPIVQPEASTSLKPAEVRVPFPQIVQKKRNEEQFSRFLDIFRKVQINIPLVEALQQMPSYAKFLKEVVSQKKK